MEAIKDYKRKQEELWIFFTALPKLPIGIRLKKDSDTGKLIEEKYDTSIFGDFNGLCRREFESILRQAEDLNSACIVDEIDLEDEIACADIKTVRKMVADYMKWPQIDPRQSRWLKSLFDAGIIDEMEFVAISNHIEFCASTMKDNVAVMKRLLQKYGTESNEKEKDRRYSAELLRLFKNDSGLIDSLVGKSDKDIAFCLKGWSKKGLIEKLENFGSKSHYAKELKTAGMIQNSESNFRQKI